MRRLPASALRGAVLATLLFVVGASLAAAQAPSTRAADVAIGGTVHDSSGAVIPRATIVVRNERSGLESVVEGNVDGSFLLACRLASSSSPYRLPDSAPPSSASKFPERRR